jgi:hypothetical protein
VQSRMDNPENTDGAIKNEQSENTEGHYWLHHRYSLDCPFLIAPSVFSGLSILDCTFSILWIVHSWLNLQYSLDCPFLTYISGTIYKTNSSLLQQ